MYQETCKNFVCNCLGLYAGTCNFIDKLCEEFDVDFDNNDLSEILSYGGKLSYVGNMLIGRLFDRIIDDACNEYCCDDEVRELFDYDCNDFCSTLSFNGEIYDKKADLYAAVEAYTLPKF